MLGDRHVEVFAGRIESQTIGPQGYTKRRHYRNYSQKQRVFFPSDGVAALVDLQNATANRVRHEEIAVAIGGDNVG